MGEDLIICETVSQSIVSSIKLLIKVRVSI